VYIQTCCSATQATGERGRLARPPRRRLRRPGGRDGRAPGQASL